MFIEGKREKGAECVSLSQWLSTFFVDGTLNIRIKIVGTIENFQKYIEIKLLFYKLHSIPPHFPHKNK